jgi:hypothetical protein
MPLRLDESGMTHGGSDDDSLDSAVGQQPFGRPSRSPHAPLIAAESAGHSPATSSHGKSQFTEWLEDEFDRIALGTPGSAALLQKERDSDELRERILRSPPKAEASLDELSASVGGHESMPEHLAKLSKRLAEPERPRLSRARPSHRARLIDEASSEQAKRVEVYEKEKEARAEEFNEKRARLAQAQKRLEQADATLAAKIAERTAWRLWMLDGLEGQGPTAATSSSSQGSARTDTSEPQ